MSAISHGTGYRGAEMQQVAMPRNIPAGTRRGILNSHGAGGLITTWAPQEYTKRGYPMFNADLGATRTQFGSDDSITAVGAAWTYMKTAAGGEVKNDKILLLGASMGALPILNWAIQNPTLVQAIVLVVPALDLDDIYQFDKGDMRSNIETAYGVSHPTAIPALATHSPVAYGLGNKSLLTMPIGIWASDNDDVASTTAVCQTWADSVNGLGGSVSVVSMGSIGHTDNQPQTTYINFFDANGGRS